MEADTAGIEQTLGLLSEAPAHLAAMADGVEPSLLHAKDVDDWSVHDIIAHLRACADVWGKNILAMIAKDNPRITYVSPRTWMRKTDYLNQEFATSFAAYIQQREELVRTLQALAIEDWSRSATIKAAKKLRTETIYDYARRITNHETQHLEQVESILRSMQRS